MDRQILFLMVLTEAALAFAFGFLGATVLVWVFGGLALLGAILFAINEWAIHRSRKILAAAIATLTGGTPDYVDSEDIFAAFLNGDYDASALLDDDEEDAA